MRKKWHDSKIGKLPYWTSKSDDLIELEADIEELLSAREELQSELRHLTQELIEKQLEALRLRHHTKDLP